MQKGEMIAQGRTAEIFEWGSNEVLKLFREFMNPAAFEHEAENHKKVYETGLPVPGITGTVEIEGRKGIIYERITGIPLLRLMSREPWNIAQYARLMAKLHVDINSCRVSGFGNLKDSIESRVKAYDKLAVDIKQKAIRALHSLPDGDMLCHGDFHPDNILITEKGPIIIDWPNATQGCPVADIARTSLLLSTGEVPPGTPLKGIIALIRSYFHSTYAKEYLKLSKLTIDEVKAWELPHAAARFIESVPGEMGELDGIIKRYID